MAQAKGSGNGEGLSLQTLVIAAAASASAAILTSHLWKGGTVIAAAMTPVIVSIVKEMLAKPMESELVKKPVQQVSRIASARRASGSRVAVEQAALPEAPIRTYSSRRRRLHLKLAIVTGLLAFVIAALVLTVPELVFGGAVSSHRSTTLFGGGGSSSSSSEKKAREGDDGSDGGGVQAPDSQQPQGQETTPAAPPPSGSDSGDGTGDEPTTPAPAPAQTTPAPAPTTPAPAPEPSTP